MLHSDETTSTEQKPPTGPPSMVGRVLYERFLVERDLADETLGTGFSSWLVKDLKNFCSEAVFKTASAPPSALTGGPSFQQVCEVLIRLGHRNIEEILETGMLFDGRPYAVTRPYGGRRLSEIIGPGGRVELDYAAAVIEQVAEALAAVHAKNVLHCDVRPTNVVIIEEGTISESVRLINFGCAWPVDVRGEMLENLSSGSESLSYAAPELQSRLGHRTNVSDIYSLAALAYRLITGRVPFDGADRVTLLGQISVGQVLSPTDFRTDLTNEAENIILSGLRFEPAWRPQEVEDFGIRLARSLRPTRRLFAPEPSTAAETTVDAEVPIETVEEQIEVPAEGPRELRRVFKDERPTPPISDRALAWALMVLLLAGALSIPISQTLLAEERPVQAVNTIVQGPSAKRPSTQLRYWFDAAKPVRGRGEPESSAAGVLGELNFSTDKPGIVMVIAESSDPTGELKYRIAYVEDGSAQPVDPSKAMRTGAYVSAEESGELVWIVWLPPDSRELEDVRKTTGAGEFISDEPARRLRHFLERNRDMRVAEKSDITTGYTILTCSGDRLVHRINAAQGRE